MKFCWAWIKLKYKPSNESLFFGTSEAYHSTKPVCCSKWQASFSFWPSHIECLICYGYLKLSPCFYNFQECAFVILKAIIVIIFILTGQSSSGPWIDHVPTDCDSILLAKKYEWTYSLTFESLAKFWFQDLTIDSSTLFICSGVVLQRLLRCWDLPSALLSDFNQLW